MKTNTQTIEQTGKIWKLFIVISTLGMLYGIGSVFSAVMNERSTMGPMIILLASFATFCGVKFLAWWNHG